MQPALAVVEAPQSQSSQEPMIQTGSLSNEPLKPEESFDDVDNWTQNPKKSSAIPEQQLAAVCQLKTVTQDDSTNIIDDNQGSFVGQEQIVPQPQNDFDVPPEQTNQDEFDTA